MMFESAIREEIRLPSGKKIRLNAQQSDALNSMRAWLNRDEDFFFTLSGYAGTGKSTITNSFIQYFYNQFPDLSLAVSAPTHKAKKVIGRITDEEAYTIQKLLGLRPNTDLETFDINNPQFDEKAEKVIYRYKLVIIDEASMLNESLFKLITQEARAAMTKILFIGDDAQLPPVKESISKIFKDVPLKAQLTQVERQSGSNPLMAIYDSIRSNIKSKSDLFKHATDVNEQGEGVIFHSNQKIFENTILPMFASDEYKADADYIKLITYTNNSVKSWNNLIRNHIFPGVTQPIVEGDVLMAYNTVMMGDDYFLIENSADYKVERVSEDKSIEDIDVYIADLKSVDSEARSTVQIVRESGMKKFIAKFSHLLNNAKSQSGFKRKYAWKEYYEFKNAHLLLADIMQDGKLLVKKDLDYGYAITTHKSQGSTFANVAISENNLDRNLDAEERNKLKYVAFSRPTTKAIILSQKALPNG